MRTVLRYTRMLLIAMTVSLANSSHAGEMTGFRIRNSISGNGLSANLCFAADFRLGKGTLSFGPNFQARKLNLSGVQCIYNYCVEPGNGAKLHLYFLGNVIYNRSAYLARGVVRLEETAFPQRCIDYSSLKLSTIESYAGFGLKISHGSHITSSWGIAMGYYYTLCKGSLCSQLFREMSGLSLALNASLCYSFGEKNNQGTRTSRFKY